MGPSAAPQARRAMSPPSRRRQHGVNATASPVKVGDGSQPLRQAVIRVLLATTLVALIAGGMAWLLGAHDVAGIFWAAGTLVAIVPAVWWVVAASGGAAWAPTSSRCSHWWASWRFTNIWRAR
jgi:hypothetical protein